MNGMSLYEFEKMLAYQSATAARQTRKAWMLIGVSQQTSQDPKLKRPLTKATAR
jgi:hypothetical protein